MTSNKATKVVLVIFIVFVLALIAGFVIEGNQQDSEPVSQEESLMYGNDYLGIDAGVDEYLQGYENILILGLDQDSIKDDEGKVNENDVVTDANLVLSVNKKTQDAKMFSILRTTPLMLNEGYGVDKMMNAYYYDGMDLAMYTVNSNLDLNIRKTIVLTSTTVREIVDELGGIELDIPASDVDAINQLLSNDNKISKEGKHLFNGEQAVQYCRYIIDGDDEARHERFKEVLQEAFHKAEALDEEEKVHFAETFVDTVYTNMTSNHLSELLIGLSKHEVVGTDVWPFVQDATLEEGVTDIHEFMFDQKGYEPTDKVKAISEKLCW